MSSSTQTPRRRLGDKFQLRRSNTKEDSDLDTSFGSSSAQLESSFASSSSGLVDANKGKASRGSVGGMGVLGTRVRSLSTGQRKAQNEDEKATKMASLPKMNRSKSSILEDGKKNSRSSRFFDALGFKSKSDLADAATSPAVDIEDDISPAEVMPHSSTPRPRLSVSGLSGRFNRANSYFSLEPASSTSGAGETSPSPGDFNLRSFRNVRGQDLYTSYPAAPGLKSAATSPLPISSASQYTIVTASDSRPDSFLSVEDNQHSSVATSPRLLSSSTNASKTDLSPSGSKQGSPRIEPQRFHSGSMSAGRFRKVTAVLNKNTDDGSGGPSTPTEGIQRLVRPNSPFVNLATSPSQTLAALEAEMIKGRTTPLMYLHQGEEAKARSGSPEPRSPTKPVRETALLPSEANENQYEGKRTHPKVDVERRGERIAPPKLPWLRDEAKMARRRRLSAQSNGQRGELISPLANVNFIGDIQDLQPRSRNLSLSSQVDHLNGAVSNSRAISSSPTHEDEFHLPEDSNGFGIGRRLQRWSMLNGATLMNGYHRRSDSTPFEETVTRPSTSINGHRRSATATHTLGQAKANELISFHEQQAPLLSAAQIRTEIPQSQNARIAWPAPPCIKLEYFSHLSALHQHSLYEQHCKAADHALAEYMRLMAGVVPQDAMTQPGTLFNTASAFRSSHLDKKGRRSSDTSAMDHGRSRSNSVPGLHGNSNQSRRRSLTPAKTDIPVPPLPSDEILEKMEKRLQSNRNRTLSEPLDNSSSLNLSSSSQQSLSRMPSAKFMTPQRAS
jgi:hypothetical protein